jgi:hypothetical protein
MRHLGAAKESFRNGFIAAGTKIVTPEIIAAHMHADHDAFGRRCHRIVDALDVEIDQHIRLLADRLDLLPDRGVAQQRDRNLVELNVAAAGIGEVRNLVAIDG